MKYFSNATSMRINILVRLIVLLVANSASTIAVLLRQQQRETIVGGSQITDSSRFPYLAYSSGTRSCGATLIWSDILLSAGHCSDAFLNLGARVGGIEERGTDGEYHDVEQVLVHPEYPASSTQPNDIMLVKLSTSSSIQPVTIATTLAQPEFGSSVKILGFGLESEDGQFSSYAKEVDVSIVNFTSCDSLYGGKLLENVQFCTESSNGDSCQGDSGGPLLNDDGVQVGIVAFGEGCHRYPSVNTRVSYFSTWIFEGVCRLSQDPPISCFSSDESSSASNATIPSLSREENDAISTNIDDETMNSLWSKTTSDPTSGSRSFFMYYSLYRRIPVLVCTIVFVFVYKY
jgi:secreted trypsin-like serine protease